MSGCVRIFPWVYDQKLQPNGEQVFAVGDVHGRYGEFQRLLGEMVKEAGPNSHLVLNGDLIDRGPDPVDVIKLAGRTMLSSQFKRRTWLLGNHDLMLFGAMAGNWNITSNWMRNGGLATLELIDPDGEARSAADLRPILIRRIGKEEFNLYEAANTHVEIGNLLLIHAGINPAYSFSKHFEIPKFAEWFGHENYHWAWVREPFLGHEGEFEGGRFVVHGHTPEKWTLEWKGRDLTEQMHHIDGWRLGLDGTRSSQRAVAGAQIEDGRYRIFLSYYE